jgi:parallel beta-helix repeat protein
MFSGNRDASDSIYLSAGTYKVSSCITSIRIIENELNEIKICSEEGLRADQVIINIGELYFQTQQPIEKITIQRVTLQNAATHRSFSIESAIETVISNCIITNNYRGIHIVNSKVIISGNTIINNTYEGIDIQNSIGKCEIVSNIISNNGYAIHASSNNNGLTISSNIVTNNNNGVSLENNYYSVISNNLILKNGNYSTSTSGYGGLKILSSNVIVLNNTITNNKTNGNGGGIYFDNAYTSQVYNNIIWSNLAKGQGDDIYINRFANFSGFYNNIYKDFDGPVDELVANSSKDPLFVDYQNDDYHLSPDSPCINTGDNTAPDLTETDLDGNPRISDNTIDIGAYEFTTTERIPSDQNEDWILTNEEFNAYAEAWRKGEPWNSGPDPIPIDYVTRSGYLQKKGETYKNEGGKKPVCWKPDDNNTKR